MKKRLFLSTFTAFLLLILTGCTDKNSADKYFGEQITSIKETNPEKLSFLLEDGIEESNSLYVLEFPEELKEAYLSFLQEAFKTVKFEVTDAKKNGKGAFTVQVSYTPLDIAAAAKETDETFLSTLSLL